MVQSYTITAKLLHWLMATAIIPLLLFGQHTMGNHFGRFWPTIHASAGFVLLLLVALRLWWRGRNERPLLVGSVLERKAAHLVHLLLYLAMIGLPLSGWLAFTEHVRRSMGVASASLFGLTKIPLLPDYGIDFHFIHRWGGRALLALIGLHAVAALKHHFIDKDNTLRRMTWGQ